MKTLMILAAGSLAGLTALVACSSDDDKSSSMGKPSSGYTDHSSPYPSCDRIIKACHPYDIGEGIVHDCHDQGHGGQKEEDCAPFEAYCLAKCGVAAAGGNPDAPDAGPDAAGDASVP